MTNARTTTTSRFGHRRAKVASRAEAPEQLRLPLADGPPAPSTVTDHGSRGEEDEWQLDERTRAIGLAGVAAARERLTRPSAA